MLSKAPATSNTSSAAMGVADGRSGAASGADTTCTVSANALLNSRTSSSAPRRGNRGFQGNGGFQVAVGRNAQLPVARSERDREAPVGVGNDRLGAARHGGSGQRRQVGAVQDDAGDDRRRLIVRCRGGPCLLGGLRRLSRFRALGEGRRQRWRQRHQNQGGWQRTGTESLRRLTERRTDRVARTLTGRVSGHRVGHESSLPSRTRSWPRHSGVPYTRVFRSGRQ